MADVGNVSASSESLLPGPGSSAYSHNSLMRTISNPIACIWFKLMVRLQNIARSLAGPPDAFPSIHPETPDASAAVGGGIIA